MKPADRLRKARIARGFATAADAARAFGFSEVTYTSHENGTRGIRMDAAERYARAFGVTVGDLLGIKPRHETVEDIPVIAQAATGRWIDDRLAKAGTPASKFTISAPDLDGTIGAMRVAIEVCDGSVSKILRSGEYAVCQTVGTGDIDSIPVGSLVWVVRRRHSLTEHSIRRIERRTDSHLTLTTYSDEPGLLDVVTYPAEAADEHIEIRGRVVARYAPLGET